MKNYSKLLVSVLMLVSVFVIPIYASEGGKTEMSQMESNSSLSILEDICAQKELYRVLDYEGQDITDALYGVITEFGAEDESAAQYMEENIMTIEKVEFEIVETSPKASEISKRCVISRFERFKPTVARRKMEIIYQVTVNFTYDPNTYRIGSYSEPILKFLTQDMGNDVTNLKIVDRVRSTQVSSNGIDLQVDYYFDLYGDYYDEVEVITKPNTYLNRHGFSTKCNGESLDTIVMEPLIPEDEKEN